MRDQNRSHPACLFAVTFGLIVSSALAQKTSPPNPSPGTTNNNPTPTRGNSGNVPLSGSGNGNVGTTLPNRLIFLSGKVMFDDGVEPNSDIRIERVCGGNPRLEAHTDAKGRFSFQLGSYSGVDTEAADSVSGGGFGSQNTQFPSSSRSSLPGSSSRLSDPMWSCELRAAYPGYRSDVVELAGRRSLDDSNVGTIILHRLVNVKGSTISVTTALAPKAAQKNYEKGMQLMQKGQFEEAEKRLQAATVAYPKYALAWFALGQAQQRENKSSEARKSYQAAIEADSKFVSPYDQLGFLAAHEGKWEDAAQYSRQAIDLNPVEFPSAFWYNAIANFNLKKTEEAARSANALVKLDSQHHYPQAEQMLAQLALTKGDYTEAAVHLRTYLQLVPNAKDADALKQQLTKIEQASAAPKQPQ
jgi:tetratricopeptide (TPR) repeat protein